MGGEYFDAVVRQVEMAAKAVRLEVQSVGKREGRTRLDDGLGQPLESESREQNVAWI